MTFYQKSIQPKAKIWRKRSEGSKLTRKVRKTGNNGRQVKSFLAIAYGKGIIMCQQWDSDVKFIGRNYKEFVKEHFPNTLELRTKYLRKTLIFIWNSALRGKFNFCFQGIFPSIDKMFFLRGRRGTRI